MADNETLQSKLRSTPTAGVSGEHSPYYRRLVSSGYKGYIQGAIGGGTLYGAIGLAIGLVASPFLIGAGLTFGAAMLAVPAIGVAMGLYGAHSFAEIGKTAAIMADSADMNEKRRYLFDRYYDPTTSNKEAAEIKRQLEEDHVSTKPTKAFHWRPALVGILLGAAVGAAIFFLPGLGAEVAVTHVLELSGLHIGGLGSALVGATLGGLVGSVIGIDREYVRRWMDKAEFTVHDTEHAEQALRQREQNIQRLAESAKEEPQADRIPPAALQARECPVSPRVTAGIEQPKSTVIAVQHLDRVAGLEQLAKSGI